MGSVWLYDLPDVLEAAGLAVDVWPGWENRARSSGGYDDVRAVFVHHTASSSSPANDMSYMWDGSGGDQPIGAIYLGRDGRLTVGAAGATNTQGKGGPWNLSRGTIPLDKGNAYGIALEAANGGTGEPWPAAQTTAYVEACRALAAAYGLDPSRDVLAHFEWCAPSCPGRKVDPVGPSPWAAGAQSWDMAAFRHDVAASSSPAPIPVPLPPTEDDEMSILIRANDGDEAQQSAVFWWDGRHLGWVRNGIAVDVGRVCGLYTSEPLENFTAAMIQQMIVSGWDGGPVPPGFYGPDAVDTGVA